MPKIIPAAIVMLLFSTSTQSADDDERQTGSFTPAKADTGSWTWIPLENTLCRDGSKTGVGVRVLPDANAVMIYLQGGGACYDAKSCEQNANAPIAGKNFSRAKFYDWVKTLGNQGVFNTENPSNPVARWNHVYVPYCTGDLHGGDREDALVPGVPGKQQFVGHRNLRNILKLVAPYFRDADDVALIGASAGGFGVLINYPQVVEAFGGRSVAALVDSAPIIPESAIQNILFSAQSDYDF